MDTRHQPSSASCPAGPASRPMTSRHTSSRQTLRGERSVSGLSSQIPAASSATVNVCPTGMTASQRVHVGSDATTSRNQRPRSATTTGSHQRHPAASHQSSTSNFSRSTAGTGVPPARPTSTASQPENGDSSYYVWARRHDRLAALQSPVRGHDYAAAGIVRSYRRIPSGTFRGEDDARSSQSPISSLTESDNISANVRWGDPAGALRHATHAVAPSLHSQAGRIVAGSTTSTTTVDRRENAVTISRYYNHPRHRTYSTPTLPVLPAASEQQPRTFLEMHKQYERTPTFRPQAQQVDWGNNLSPHSPGYTLSAIRQRRETLTRTFPQPQNAVSSAAEQRVFAGPFMDAPRRFSTMGNAERIAMQDAALVDVKGVEVEVEIEEEQQKKPGKWRKVSGLFNRTLGRKSKGSPSVQHSPTHASPSTSHSTPSLVDSPPKPLATPQVPTPPVATAVATRPREARPLSPLVIPQFRTRPAARIVIPARHVQHSPVSPLNEADPHSRGTEGLSPVSPLNKPAFPSPQQNPTSSFRTPKTLITEAEAELLHCLRAASALPRHRGQAFTSHRKSPENVEDSGEELLPLEQLDRDLFPPPLVVQKRWKRRSPSPPSAPSWQERGHGYGPVEEKSPWVDAQAVRVVAKGKGRLVNANTNNDNNEESLLDDRFRPVVLEAPGLDSMSGGGGGGGAEHDGANGDESKVRRDTTFDGADVEERKRGEDEDEDEEMRDDDQDEDGRSTTAPSWRSGDSRKFSPRVAISGLRPS